MSEEEKQEEVQEGNHEVGVEQLLAQAQQVDMMGIPVDWNALCVKIYNIANTSIGKLTARIAELEAEIVALKEAYAGSE